MSGYVLIVMGPCGCGKSTVGKRLARALNAPFYDADDFHSVDNIKKMRSGQPLTDEDRQGWLGSLSCLIKQWQKANRLTVLACSALKQTYRQILGVDQQRIFTLYLKGDAALLTKRLLNRAGHFMSARMLQSQLDTLEEPEGGLCVNVALSLAQIEQWAVESVGQWVGD